MLEPDDWKLSRPGSKALKNNNLYRLRSDLGRILPIGFAHRRSNSELFQGFA